MAYPTKVIRVAIADDQEIFREGIANLIKAMPGMKLVFAAENGKILFQEIPQCKPDVVLVDYRMPEMNGIETTKAIKASYPGVRVLLLSMYDDVEFVEAAIENGAHGYLSKDDNASEIEKAIHSSLETGYYLNDRTSKVLIARMMEQGSLSPSFKKSMCEFTQQEIDVLQMICEEKTTQEIADSLFKSTRTIEGVRMLMMQKTGARNAVGLVMYGIKQGYVKI